MGDPVILTVPDYTNKALATPNVDTSIADILLDQLSPRLPGSGTLSTLAAGDIPKNMLFLNGDCDAGMTASKTSVVSDDLAGLGDDILNNQWYLGVVKNANSVGNAPTGQFRLITDYATSTGTFTTEAFSANVEASDSIVIAHRCILDSVHKSVTYTSGSGNWTCPVGVTKINVRLVGGGGGAGRQTGGYASGGGGGEIVELKDYPVTPGTNYAYAVGAAGAGATSSDGDSGGNSSFDGISAYGGKGGGVQAIGAGGHAISTYGVTGASAGKGVAHTGGVAPITFDMYHGMIGQTIGGLFIARIGGGSGGRGGTDNYFGPGGDSIGIGGCQAGNSDYAGSGGGSLGPGANGVNSSSTPSAPSGYGGGGAAGYNCNGGNGAPGVVQLWW